MVRDGCELPRRLLQADQSAYLHLGRARLPGAVAMEVGEHDLPDVVLEVDHTTDVYRRSSNLPLGFQSLWRTTHGISDSLRSPRIRIPVGC